MSELYLKDNKVLTLKDMEGVPSEVIKIDAPELLPLSLKQRCTSEDFRKWLKARSIPDEREGLDEIKKDFGEEWLHNKNYASLSDQYWIKWRTETWKKINFFNNTYDRDVGDMVFKPWEISVQKRYRNNCPDLTTGGILKKRWMQYSDKSSCLIKAGSIMTHQEPLSEVLVSVLAEQLGTIKCVKYDLWVEGVTICSKCDNFITQDTELVPASDIYYQKERGENESVYMHLLNACDDFEIPGAKEFIDWMIFIDNTTGNEDRNLSNIGFIRDVNTLKFLGPAPLYDSGNAYWSTKKINDTVKSKLFGDVENNLFKQLKNKCDVESILKIGMFQKLIETYPGISDEKKENLITAIKDRNNRLCKSASLEEMAGR